MDIQTVCASAVVAAQKARPTDRQHLLISLRAMHPNAAIRHAITEIETMQAERIASLQSRMVIRHA